MASHRQARNNIAALESYLTGNKLVKKIMLACAEGHHYIELELVAPWQDDFYKSPACMPHEWYGVELRYVCRRTDLISVADAVDPRFNDDDEEAFDDTARSKTLISKDSAVEYRKAA